MTDGLSASSTGTCRCLVVHRAWDTSAAELPVSGRQPKLTSLFQTHRHSQAPTGSHRGPPQAHASDSAGPRGLPSRAPTAHTPTHKPGTHTTHQSATNLRPITSQNLVCFCHLQPNRIGLLSCLPETKKIRALSLSSSSPKPLRIPETPSTSPPPFPQEKAVVDIVSILLRNPDRTLQVKEFIFPRFCISTPRLRFASSLSTIAGGQLTTAHAS